MKIKWWGHSCFALKGSQETVVTDPYGAIGYQLVADPAVVVTISHDHFDHNAYDSVPGNPVVVTDLDERTVGGIHVNGVGSFHDPDQGSQRGTNRIYVITMDGITVCHLGDLGESLNERHREAIGAVDVLLVPVGGHFTIGPKEAFEAVQRLEPAVVIPMHYKTSVVEFPIQAEDGFLSFFPAERVKRFDTPEVELQELPEVQSVYVLSYPTD